MTAIPQTSPEERYVIALAYQTLGQVLGSIAGYGNHRAIATSHEEGVRIVLSIEQIDGPEVSRWRPTSQEAVTTTALRDIEQNILDACTNSPQSIRQLARSTGYGNNTHFREAVYRLLELRLIVRIRGGICLR